MINYSDNLEEIKDLYARCKEAFNVDWDTGLIITYGNNVYCKFDLSDEMKAHEETHVRQQEKMGNDFWWELYLTDPHFRLSQEVEAYQNQIEYGNKHLNRKARQHRKKFILDCMVNMYGKMCSHEQAEKLLYTK